MKEAVLTKKIQLKELEMLKELKDTLDKYQIEYFLAYGTTLGAVRHKGFIPWDDDIDIYIWGKDYKRFKEIFTEIYKGDLVLHDYETENNYPYSFPKIVSKSTRLKESAFKHLDYNCGVYIDVFLLYSVPDNLFFRTLEEKFKYILYCFVRLYYAPFNRYKYISKIIKKIIPIKVINRILYRLYEVYHDSKYVTCCLEFSIDRCIPKKYFKNHISMVFENESFSLMESYDDYLTLCYGDYMKLPPVRNRVSNHSFSFLKL